MICELDYQQHSNYLIIDILTHIEIVDKHGGNIKLTRFYKAFDRLILNIWRFLNGSYLTPKYLFYFQ